MVIRFFNNFIKLPNRKPKISDRKIIKLPVEKSEENCLFFDGYISVENNRDHLDIKVTQKGLDKLSECKNPNDPIKLLRKLSKKEELDVIPEEKYDNPVCSAYREGAYRVLVDTCLVRYKQLFLEHRKNKV